MHRSSVIKNIVDKAKDQLSDPRIPRSYALKLTTITNDKLNEYIADMIIKTLANIGAKPNSVRKEFKFEYPPGTERIYNGKEGLALAICADLLGVQYLKNNFPEWEKTPELTAISYAARAISVSAIAFGARIRNMSSEQYVIDNRAIPDQQFSDPEPGPYALRMSVAADSLYQKIRHINELKREIIDFMAAMVREHGFLVPEAIFARVSLKIIELKNAETEAEKKYDELADYIYKHENYMQNLEIQARNASPDWIAKYKAMRDDPRDHANQAYRLIKEIEATKSEPVTAEMIERIARQLANEEYTRIYAEEDFSIAPQPFRAVLKDQESKYAKWK